MINELSNKYNNKDFYTFMGNLWMQKYREYTKIFSKNRIFIITFNPLLKNKKFCE